MQQFYRLIPVARITRRFLVLKHGCVPNEDGIRGETGSPTANSRETGSARVDLPSNFSIIKARIQIFIQFSTFFILARNEFFNSYSKSINFQFCVKHYACN